MPARHSRAYFGNDIETISGELVDIDWRNPHIGLDRARFRPGMQVTVSGRSSTRQARALLMTSIVLPNGRTLEFERRTAPAGHVDTVVDAAAENKGIFRVWSMPAADRAAIQGQLADQPFTDAAVAARASWNPLDNFALRCEPEGMPRIVLNPHSFELTDRGDEILLRTEFYDTVRVIHMNAGAAPKDAPASRLGYSVGAWEDASLVVRTSRINWPWFDNAGAPQSPDVEIVERFTLSDDQTRLDFDITVIDPATFTRPARLRGYWLALGESILRYDCKPLQQ